MNERDIRLMGSILEYLGDPREGGVVLFDVRSTQLARVTLILLKGLLDERGMCGIFISVDRPHQYMVHLMRMHQISSARLTFIDAISRFSGDRRMGEANVGFVDTPFHIDTLPSTLKDWSYPSNDRMVNLRNTDFAMIDNIATLLNFNRFTSVERFLRSFVALTQEDHAVLVPILVDGERHGLLFETARSLADREVKVMPDFSLSSEDWHAGHVMSNSSFKKEVR